MRTTYLRGATSVAIAVLVLSACQGGTSTGSSQPAGGASNAVAGSFPNACNPLTTDEIKAAVGFAVKPGVLQASDGNSDCHWDSQTSDDTVGLTVQTYDDSLWRAGASTSDAKTVSGIGDAAYKNWPTAGTLNIKAKGYQVVVAVISFSIAADKVDSDDVTLANLVLPRL